MSKPTFYTFGLSVWSAAPELALAELGYPDDAIETKVVNLVEGENFTPQFIEINPNATLPTLVADGKAYTNTKDVVRYLIEHAPKKDVAPGTAFIDKIHEDSIDPNAPLLLARNEEELNASASGFPFTFVQNRQNSLEKHSVLPEAAPLKSIYDEKKKGNGSFLSVYKGEVPEETKQAFFKQSIQHWNNLVSFILNDLPAALPESGFLGGQNPGEDDFHLAAWLVRIAHLVGASADKDGIKALEKETKKPIPPKVAAYWAAWVERPSFKKVYVNGLH
ncbi:hypothetical protein PYCCODRAFT_1434403 [Trametes coccinea BRFM310]|uniref:GST N-terminal domain-containing protein n=1 Tax=Trametes coccinea (strain BRFM310) TaxID=1353009 RepID=A0A1Y2IQW4_TRAC3|nr:hypothetical protein PYCCODRAFT_1434403 [Trametes coccinea BRFM310]